MKYEFFVPGEPKGKARPMVTRNGTFTPATTREYEKRVVLAFRMKYHAAEPFVKGTPVWMKIKAYFKPSAKTINKAKRKPEHSILPTKKPDWDNIGKIVCDSLNGIVYHDDAQVIDCRVTKAYAFGSGEPGVRVTISDEKIGEESQNENDN